VRAEWEYDQALDTDDDPVLGELSSSTRFVDGEAYTTSIPVYDDAYQPLATTVTLPDLPVFVDALDSLSFTTAYTYTADGQVASVSLPAVVTEAGVKELGAETVTTRFDTASMPSWMSGGFGWGTYVAESRFGPDGRAIAADLGNTYGAVVSYGYEDGTNRLSGIALTRQNFGVAVDIGYGYDAAGNVTSVKDQASASPALQDNQCFGYDGLRRLEVAWTAGDADCAVAQSAIQVSDVGGVESYWAEYEYDPLGNRTSMVEHVVGGAAVELTTTYAHAGSPHQVTGRTESVGGVPLSTTTYGYDDAGNRVSSAVNSVTTDLVWDAEGELIGVDDEAYVYDASGNRVVRSAADGTTVYLPGGQEILIDGSTVSASRYYSFGGQTVATRTGAGLGGVTSLVADHHGSVVAAVPNTEWTASSVERVFWDPFGGIRGDSDADVPGDHRFLGAVREADSGLTLLGARYYDATVGRFVSVDPELDPQNPAQFNAYVYSGNNPLTWSDPTGRDWWNDMWGGFNDFFRGYDIRVSGDIHSRPGAALIASISATARTGPASVNIYEDLLVAADGRWYADIPKTEVPWVGEAFPTPTQSDWEAVVLAQLGPPAITAGAAGSTLAAGSSLGGVGSGSGPWTQGIKATEGGAEGQITNASCVSACGAMLSGGARSQEDLLAELGEWSNPRSLAQALGDGWEGRMFMSADDAVAAANRGPMGATLQAPGTPGHMVVTTPLGNGRYGVQDPWRGGSNYEVGTDWIEQYVSGGTYRK
jgi:RHS repeat-associated protein